MSALIIHTGNIYERVAIVNKIIEKIASCGRGFFGNSDGSVAKLFITRTKVIYTSVYTGDVIIWQDKPLEKHIGGGTLEGLVKDFAHYVFTGEYSNHKNGYGGLYCIYWGYPEADMLEIQSYARELGYLTESRP